jgi:Tfp pilus assembly protein PilF
VTGLVGPPAIMLALSAMQSGNGLLATLALDRALGADPNDGLAKALAAYHQLGLSPAEITASLRS